MSIMSYYQWNPGINTAGCNNAVVHYDAHYGKNPPVSSCRCGLYGKYYPDDFKDVIGFGWGGPLVLGAIEAHGRVILGTKGFRAEKVRILGLAPFQAIDCSKIPLLANHYLVNYYDQIQDLVENFPPSDVSNLVPKETPEAPNYLVVTGRRWGKTHSYAANTWKDLCQKEFEDDMKTFQGISYEAKVCGDAIRTMLERFNEKTYTANMWKEIARKLVIND
jgi:hypothetical protein